jgi:hypothetical protein
MTDASRPESLPMHLELARVRDPSLYVRLTGISGLDHPYIEHCWQPILGSRAIELLREVHELTGPPGAPPHSIPCDVLSWRLGFQPCHRPTKINPIGRAMRTARRYGVARCSLERGVVELYDPLPLLPEAFAAKLPPEGLDHHLQRLDEVAQGIASGRVEGSEAGKLHVVHRIAQERRLLTHLGAASDSTRARPAPPEVSL